MLLPKPKITCAHVAISSQGLAIGWIMSAAVATNYMCKVITENEPINFVQFLG